MGYDYTGSVVGVTLKKAGYYKLEVWGAQGGGDVATGYYYGGLGGYSIGVYNASQNSVINVIVGQKGFSSYTTLAYNGGGHSDYNSNADKPVGADTGYTGGGATHISTYNCGELKNCSSYKSNILIVAGAGGGSAGCGNSSVVDACYSNNPKYNAYGGNGGGSQGYDGGTDSSGRVGAKGGSQSSGGAGSTDGHGYSNPGAFGLGGSVTPVSDIPSLSNGDCIQGGGGGGGWYGGGSGTEGGGGGGGGSGYIGNSLLLSTKGIIKQMYMYSGYTGCSSNSTTSTRTTCTSNYSSSAISNYAKSENGYARITYLGT